MNQIQKLKEWIESRIEKHEPIGYSERDDIRADECRAILDHLNSLPSAPEDGETESLTAGELLLCDPKPAIVEGLKRWEYEYEMGNLTKALEGFEREHESDPKKVRILMGRYAMALASAKNVIDSLTPRPTPVSLEGLRDHLLAFVNYLNGNANDDLIYGEQVDTYLYELKNGKGKPFVFFDILTPHPNTPEPSGEEWYTELIRLVGDLRDGFFLCDDNNCLNVCDHFDSAPLSIGEKQLAHRWIAMYSKSVFDTSTEESNNDATEFLKGLTPHPVSPPKTEGGYKCEGCGCDTDMIQPYCHQCEHESIVKNEVRLALEEASQAILSKRFFAERGHFGGEQAVRVKDIQQAFITPLTNK